MNYCIALKNIINDCEIRKKKKKKCFKFEVNSKGDTV